MVSPKLHKLIWILGIPFVLFVVLICLIAWIDYSEYFVSKYSTYSEVIEKNAIGPGRWLPEFLPKGAINIEEVHKIDTSERWISFTLQKNEALDFSRSLVPVTLSEAKSSLYRVSSRTSGWPKVLRNKKSSSIDKKDNLSTYKTSDGAYGVAIDFAKQRIFIWSTTEPAG